MSNLKRMFNEWDKKTKNMEKPRHCLKCNEIFDNWRDIVVCDDCLAEFREDRKNGCSSGYLTIDMYLIKEAEK